MLRQQSKQQKMAVHDSSDVAAIGDTGNDSAGVAIRRDNTVISNTVTDSDGLIQPSRRRRRDLPAEIH